jgi:hypothetical protein
MNEGGNAIATGQDGSRERTWRDAARPLRVDVARYRRARREVSPVTLGSLPQHQLGVATHHRDGGLLNSFRKELPLDKILGLNGHLLIQPLDSPLIDSGRRPIMMVLAAPRCTVVRLALARSPFYTNGVLVRGIRALDPSWPGSDRRSRSSKRWRLRRGASPSGPAGDVVGACRRQRRWWCWCGAVRPARPGERPRRWRRLKIGIPNTTLCPSICRYRRRIGSSALARHRDRAYGHPTASTPQAIGGGAAPSHRIDWRGRNATF